MVAGKERKRKETTRTARNNVLRKRNPPPVLPLLFFKLMCVGKCLLPFFFMRKKLMDVKIFPVNARRYAETFPRFVRPHVKSRRLPSHKVWPCYWTKILINCCCWLPYQSVGRRSNAAPRCHSYSCYYQRLSCARVVAWSHGRVIRNRFAAKYVLACTRWVRMLAYVELMKHYCQLHRISAFFPSILISSKIGG